MVRALSTGHKVYRVRILSKGWMFVSDTNLNNVPGLFGLSVQKMTVGRETNQTISEGYSERNRQGYI